MKNQSIFFALSLTLLMPTIGAFEQEKNDIKITVIDYAQTPNKVVLYGGVPLKPSDFLCKDLYPVRVTIFNKSDKPVIISKRSVRAWLLSAEDVSPSFYDEHRNFKFFPYATVEKMFVGGLATAGSSMAIPPFTTIISPIVGVVSTFAYSFMLAAKRQRTQQEFERQMLQEKIIILPNRKVSKLLVFDRGFNKMQFTFFVHDAQEADYAASFDVDLGG